MDPALDSPQPGRTEVPMGRIGLAVVLLERISPQPVSIVI